MSRSRQLLFLLVGLYLVGFTALAVIRGNTEFLFYIVTMLVTIALVLLADRRVKFTDLTFWGLGIWGLMHLCGGLVQVRGDVLYNLWIIPPDIFKYDNLVHAFGFGAATLACWDALRAAAPDIRLSKGVATGIVLMACGLGAVNEIIEFAATLLVPDTNVGGFQNAMLDLVFNLVGAVLGATLIAIRQPRRKPRRKSESA